MNFRPTTIGYVESSLTTDASPFPLSPLVMITLAGNAPLPESTDNGVSEVRYIAELVPSSLAKEPQRRRTRANHACRSEAEGLPHLERASGWVDVQVRTGQNCLSETGLHPTQHPLRALQRRVWRGQRSETPVASVWHSLGVRAGG